MSPLLSEHLGADHLMIAGENLRSFLPPRLQKKFDIHLENYIEISDFKRNIRFDIPSLISPLLMKCYHLPSFDDSEKLKTIKIVGNFLI